ncbi:uncharacterized protein LOC122573413 isoform X2 [Bombus pyrosoma]|uniref:uncharacterized protein LOC122573413 isoform X2 n=1 Tax=Bombus pyrosoma TaxID=396416 RepID=UPI001CB96B44|nr:uncharacterized protein LOC122573413 isoform X2 [Bombus pyrosoma]
MQRSRVCYVCARPCINDIPRKASERRRIDTKQRGIRVSGTAITSSSVVAEIEQQPDAYSRSRTESLRNLPVVTRSSFILIELGSLRHGLKYSGAQFLWRWNSVG